jgi:hypothetical protein
MNTTAPNNARREAVRRAAHRAELHRATVDAYLFVRTFADQLATHQSSLVNAKEQS